MTPTTAPMTPTTTLKAGPLDGWTVEVVWLDMTSKATGPVVGVRPLGDGWQLLVKRYDSTRAYTLPEGALALGVPKQLVREITAKWLAQV